MEKRARQQRRAQACGHGLAGIDGEALCCELTGKGYGMLPVGLVTFGNCLIPFQVSPMCLQKSERSKDQGDDQATGKDGPLEPRRPICGAARCRDVLTLVGSRRGSGLRCRTAGRCRVSGDAPDAPWSVVSTRYDDACP